MSILCFAWQDQNRHYFYTAVSTLFTWWNPDSQLMVAVKVCEMCEAYSEG